MIWQSYTGGYVIPSYFNPEGKKHGVLVLPTGAGKTRVGMQAIETVNAPAFAVVPTLNLVDQWIS